MVFLAKVSSSSAKPIVKGGAAAEKFCCFRKSPIGRGYALAAQGCALRLAGQGLPAMQSNVDAAIALG
jgi:hypothetical protein